MDVEARIKKKKIKFQATFIVHGRASHCTDRAPLMPKPCLTSARHTHGPCASLHDVLPLIFQLWSTG